MAAAESRRGNEQAVAYKFVNIDVAPLSYDGRRVLHIARTSSILGIGLLILPDLRVALVRPRLSATVSDRPRIRPVMYDNLGQAVDVSKKLAEIWAKSFSDPGVSCVLFNYTVYKASGGLPTFTTDEGRRADGEEDLRRRATLYKRIRAVGDAIPVLEISRDMADRPEFPPRRIIKPRLLDFSPPLQGISDN